MIKCIAIDDDTLFLKVLINYFHGYDGMDLIEVFDNPVEGVMSVVKKKPDVLLLDIEMPYLDGFETLSTLDKKPKIIVISGHLNNPDLPKIGIDKYLSKSALRDPEILRKAILEVMGQSSE